MSWKTPANALAGILACIAMSACGSDSERSFSNTGGAAGSAGSGGSAGSATGGSAGSTGGSAGSTGGGAGSGSGGAAGSSGSSGTGGSAGAGGCGAGLTDCSGTCVNLMNDGKNCGFCGHDCQNTTCSAGGCAPSAVLLADKVSNLDIDSTHVYFTQTGNPAGSSFVKRVMKSGGSATTLASSQNSPSAIFVTNKVYWGGAIYVRSMAKTGGATTTLTGYRPSRFAQNNSQLFLSHFSFSPSGYDIRKVNKAGGGEGSVYFDDKTISGLAATGSDVFWTKSATAGIRRKATNAPAAAAPTIIFGSEKSPQELQVEGSDLIWTVVSGSNWQVRRGTFAGAGASTLLSLPSGNQKGLVVTNNAIFWVETVNSVVVMRAADRDGKNVRTLSGDLGPGPSALRADSKWVYYRTTGGIFRVSR